MKTYVVAVVVSEWLGLIDALYLVKIDAETANIAHEKGRQHFFDKGYKINMSTVGEV